MNIELLYFEGCAHWVEARKLLSEVLTEQALPDEVTLVTVDSNEEAQRQHFVGSPSIRVNGIDVEPDAPDEGFNMECRLYWIGGKPLGVPDREWIVAAIAEAAG